MRRDSVWNSSNAQVYAFAEDEYTSGGVRLQLRTYYDDGSRRTSGYDASNAQPYWTYEEDYKADGWRSQLRTYYDDGARRTTGFDTTGLAWTTYEEDYNAAGQSVAYRTYFDDGTRTATYYDPANSSIWSTIEETYDGLNSETSYHHDLRRWRRFACARRHQFGRRWRIRVARTVDAI